MPHNTPDFSRRAQLTELMDEPCSREEMRACLRDLSRVNRWTMAYRPLLAWLDSMTTVLRPLQPLRVLDVGCGYGDGLRRIERWAGARGISIELVGLDLNADTTAIAAELTSSASRIRWVNADILAYIPPRPPHLVMSSLFTHHLTESDIVRFVRWMELNAQAGWFINDLSRAAFPYHFFRIFSKAMRLHRFVQHDGPVSIARAFIPEDWRTIFAAAGLSQHDVTIQSFTPARLCVARRKIA